ncbi:hypothetical protein PTSG_04541 [Salpingoeca rosetta]|uniref:Bestrophin homolog n=1 Tax=Salpingoeca rosetta (strain ATCC 50818 / BSB-021) TaxID=946362 RepID=F2U7Q9_SALR5|nr:uncharacterized protein PTSG_04541 [Salpingoeca rosetta]EGD72814.1 hypothetical protein PTSG_04541 [Salpingoeca rosetta]|eukprot:XP_004994637.1 hypothetical protein PTSG_04541 [Salpingoeca rosetta]
MGIFNPDPYDHLKDPPLWKKDLRRSKQSSTSYVQPLSIFRQGLFSVWRYSIWQAVVPELLIWLLMYGIVGAVYRLSDDHVQSRMEAFFSYCKSFQGLIPLTFVLGFYVTQVYGRWWSQWQAIPWIGKIAILIHDMDDRDGPEGLHVRWTFMRWILLGMGITFQRISTSFRKLYPDLQSFMDAGLLTHEERELLETCEAQVEICYLWAGELLRRAERDRPQHVVSSSHLRLLRTELVAWRTSNAILRGFNNHPIPIVMVNIIGFAVYSYFLAAVFGRQFHLSNEAAPSSSPRLRNGETVDYYLPWFGMMEFIFFVGWFKVSAMMYDPFSAHGCEHVLKRVWDEEVSWGRQGAAFRYWKHMPSMDAPLGMDATFGHIPFGLEPTKATPLLTSTEIEEEVGLGDEAGTYMHHRKTITQRPFGPPMMQSTAFRAHVTQDSLDRTPTRPNDSNGNSSGGGGGGGLREPLLGNNEELIDTGE